MIKTMFAFGVLAAAAAAPVAAQTALPKCSATVHDSCDQGADNANAMTAEQAMASGGVGDRGHDDAAHMGSGKMMKKPMHKKMIHTTSVGHNPDPTAPTKPQ